MDSFRHWHWLTISIRIPRSSSYWVATKITPQNKRREFQKPELTSAVALPYSLLKKVQAFLRQAERFNDNSSLCLSLSNRDTIEWRPQVSPIDALSTLPRSLSASLIVLDYLRDLGCERYDESQVVQIEMVDPPNYFCSSLNGVSYRSLRLNLRTLLRPPDCSMLFALSIARIALLAP